MLARHSSYRLLERDVLNNAAAVALTQKLLETGIVENIPPILPGDCAYNLLWKHYFNICHAVGAGITQVLGKTASNKVVLGVVGSYFRIRFGRRACAKAKIPTNS